MGLARSFQLALTLPQSLSELAFENTKLPDLIADGRNFGLQQLAHVRTGLTILTLQYQQLANFEKRKSQLLSAPDKLNPPNILRAEQAKTAFRSWWALQEPLFFIEPNGVHAQTGLLGNPPDLNSIPGHTTPTIHSGVNSRVKGFW